MTPKPTPTPPIRSNAGLEIAYRRKLIALIERMHRATLRTVTAVYKDRESEIVGDSDKGSPVVDVGGEARRRAAQFQKLFNIEADSIAEWIIGRINITVTSTAKTLLKKKLPLIEFTPSRIYNNQMNALIDGNICLIKTIPEQYFASVQEIVTRNIARGNDLFSMTNELEARYDITRRRAEIIARDQTSKATSQMANTRMKSIGLEYAIWRHSGAGATQRPLHVRANGRPFRIADGMKIEGEWILPAFMINCKCVSQYLTEGLDYPSGGEPKGFKSEYPDLQ